MRHSVLTVVAATLLTAPMLHAQSATTVRGVVYDSLTRQPLANARVELAGSPRAAVTDRRGAFSLDSVPLGPQRMTFSAPSLDSIGLYGFARDIDVRAGLGSITLATPSFATFYTRLCSPTDKPAADSAIVFGTVYDAMSRARVRDAGLNLTWFAVDTTNGGMRLTEPLRSARADGDGNYGLCGLPHDIALSTTAGTPNAASGTVSLTIGPARLLRRDLYISDEMGRDSAAARKGSGELRGVVRDERGNTMIGALLLLGASGHTARTDSLGRYRFANVPLGTQEISVRQLGRGALYRTVDIVAGETPDEAFVLPEATVLAAVNVRGLALPGRDQTEFMARRRQGFGYFLNDKELSIRPDMVSALGRMPGLDVRRSASGVSLRNTRGYQCGSPQIVIDGVPSAVWANSTALPLSDADAGAGPVPNMRLETLIMRDVMAVEYFPDGNTAPTKYAFGPPNRCGMLLIWTRFARW